MKFTISVLLLCGLVCLICSSCTKNTVTTKTVTDTVTVAPTPSIMELLTEKQWIYDSTYINYTGPNTGTLVYARGSTTNTYMRDDARFIFWPDGYEDTFNATGVGSGYEEQKWSFADTDSNELYYPVYNLITTPDYQRILKLDATHLNLYDSTYQALDVFESKP